jgi:hypothetical protein
MTGKKCLHVFSTDTNIFDHWLVEPADEESNRGAKEIRLEKMVQCHHQNV